MSTPTISAQYTFLMGQRVKVIHYPLTPVDTETYVGDCGRVDHYYDTTQGIRYYQVKLDKLGATRTFLAAELEPETVHKVLIPYTLSSYKQWAKVGKRVKVERTSSINGVVVSSDSQSLKIKTDGRGMTYTYFYNESADSNGVTITEIPEPDPLWSYGHMVLDKISLVWARGAELWYRIDGGYRTRTDEEMMQWKPLKVIGEPIKNED